MKKQIIILITSFFFLSQIHAQENKQAITTKKNRFDISLSYYGEMMLHPGVKTGLGYPLLSKDNQKTITKKRNNVTVLKTTTHQLIGQVNLGFYRHVRNHTNTFLNVEVGYRIKLERQKSEKPTRGMQFEVLAGIGPSYYFLTGDTYVFDGEQTSVKKNAGNLAWMKTVSISMGGRIPNQWKKAIYWYFKPGAFWEKPVNLGSLVHPVLELGFRYEL